MEPNITTPSCICPARKPRVSAFMLATTITIIGVLLTSNCVLAITSLISEHAASNLATKVTQMMMEKTTLRIKSALDKATGIADGAQAGLLIAPSAPMPHEDDKATWHKKWHSFATMYQKAIGPQALSFTFWFEDGSHAAAATYYPYRGADLRMICERWQGGSRPVTASTLLNITTIHYNYSNMQYIETTGYSVRRDQRQFAAFNQSLAMFSHGFSSVDVSSIEFYLSLRVAFPLYNASSVYLGIGEIQLRLDSFESLVEDWAPTLHSHFVLLSRKRRVIAAGIAGLPAVTSTVVSYDYSLTESEQDSGCTMSPSIAKYDKYLYCLKDFKTFGFPPLRVMGEMGLIPSAGNNSPISSDVGRVELGSLGTYFIAIVDYNLYFPSLDWISIVFVPEEEILKDIVKGRNIAIGVSFGVAIFFAIVNGLILRFILRPLGVIADRMHSSAYLEGERDPCQKYTEKYAPEDSDGIASNFSQGESKTKPKESRVLSYLTDVASIQSAYWRMSDELGVLRGYIPEHVRDQLLASNVTEKTSEAMTPPPESSNGVSPELSHWSKEEETPASDQLSLQPPAMPAPTVVVDAQLAQAGAASDDKLSAFDSFRNYSEELNGLTQNEPLPSFFSGNGLVERSVTVALVNVVGFHHHVFNSHPDLVIKEHEYFVAYIHEVARRLGGVLDNFNGDKFWVSFNASTLCENSAVAATLFAHEVAATVNGEAAKHRRQMTNSVTLPDGKPPLSPQRPRFRVALSGVTIGVATGRAYVGPLGTRHIRRHAVISSAMSEAFAFERLAARYPDCGVMVGGDMIPAIEGYFQYLLLDAMTLPGSNGLRRRIASIKGLMHCRKQPPIPVHMDWPRVVKRLPSKNPFESANECFNAFLEGRSPEVTQRLGAICNHVDLSRQFHLTRRSSVHHLPDGRNILSPSECDSVALMVGFLSAVAKGDGRQYRSPLGDLFERPS